MLIVFGLQQLTGLILNIILGLYFFKISDASWKKSLFKHFFESPQQVRRVFVFQNRDNIHTCLSRSSRPEVFCKKGVLRNFTKFTGKHLRQNFIVNFEHISHLVPLFLLLTLNLHVPAGLHMKVIMLVQRPYTGVSRSLKH